jgi:hypothetical protein
MVILIYGPTIRCDALPAAEQMDVRKNIADRMIANISWNAGSSPWEAYTTPFGDTLIPFDSTTSSTVVYTSQLPIHTVTIRMTSSSLPLC